MTFSELQYKSHKCFDREGVEDEKM
uniref:Uncharacterized protein n=1 Tax=Anguilla anguilla TaxID=7936 RepID=A0A0E9V1U7_ANGAN